MTDSTRKAPIMITPLPRYTWTAHHLGILVARSVWSEPDQGAARDKAMRVAELLGGRARDYSLRTEAVLVSLTPLSAAEERAQMGRLD